MKKRLIILSILAIVVGLFPLNHSFASELSNKLKGRILLQVESKGEAWYVNPKDSNRYYMANGSEAYNIMRRLGVGITNKDLEKIKADKNIAKKQQGKIFLQVENHGEAYYIDINGNNYYLKDGEAAYQIMRQLGLGIKNSDLIKITLSEKDKTASSSLEFYQVVDVVDGDTIKVNINNETKTLRLIGLDTPETLDPRKPVQCFGQEASQKAKELLLGKEVRLEVDSTQENIDKYGRLLRYVWLDDGTLYNEKMIKDGYAHEYTYEVAYKYQVQFKAAQKEAQDNKRGFWSLNTCNGDTTKEAQQLVSTTTPQVSLNQTSGKYYTSSYSTSKYYYPESCKGWEDLNASYLKSFNSLEDLLKSYSSKVLSPSCK